MLLSMVTCPALPILSGEPQGSILDPLFLVLYINDLPSVVSAMRVFLFADDTKIIKSIKCESECLTLQGMLDCVSAWKDTWRLKFNEQMCTTIRFGKEEVILLQCTHSMGFLLSPFPVSKIWA